MNELSASSAQSYYIIAFWPCGQMETSAVSFLVCEMGLDFLMEAEVVASFVLMSVSTWSQNKKGRLTVTDKDQSTRDGEDAQTPIPRSSSLVSGRRWELSREFNWSYNPLGGWLRETVKGGPESVRRWKRPGRWRCKLGILRSFVVLWRLQPATDGRGPSYGQKWRRGGWAVNQAVHNERSVGSNWRST